jgi:hypothetical protein
LDDEESSFMADLYKDEFSNKINDRKKLALMRKWIQTKKTN